MSVEQIEQITVITTNIYNMECPNLDIGERVGSTGYIDFITQNEMSSSVNKGVDIYGRKFINILANIQYEDGYVKKTLTSLFQRYPGDETIWVSCRGPELSMILKPYGAMNLDQLNLLRTLLEEKSVVITGEINRKCNITKYNETYSINGDNTDRNPPIRIYLDIIQC